MSLRICFFACALLKVAQITGVFAADLKDNPLATESVLTFQYPPFDKIKDDHFVPAIEAGMREQLKEIKAIATTPRNRRSKTRSSPWNAPGDCWIAPSAPFRT